ncbi:G protein-regulated inducer of neurite outgrowth 2 [Discoglossus pictus]
MANWNHRLSTHSYQETINVVPCLMKTSQDGHSLSKSSSSLPCSGQGSSQKNQDVHQSLNSVLCPSRCNKNNVHHLGNCPSSPIQDGDLESCIRQNNCNNVTTDLLEEKAQHRSLHLSVDSSLAPKELEDKRNFVRSNVSENVSLLGCPEMPVSKAQSVDKLDATGVGVQKSFSDYFCGSRPPVSSPIMKHKKPSATYSTLCSSSSFSDSGSDGACSIKYNSGTDQSPSNTQNNLTEVICPAKDQNISLCHLDSSSIHHNITVYTAPGTYHHGILGPKNSGNGFPNYGHMYSQRYYNITGGMSCDNISSTKHSPPPMIIHNSCTMHCCTVHETLSKVEDTFAAYCHSLPISSVQFSPGLVCPISDPVQTAPPLCPLLSPPGMTAFPKLVSSVSESGLDAKKMIRCGHLPFNPPQMSFGEMHINTSIRDSNEVLSKTSESSSENLQTADSGAGKKDTWTMTSTNYLTIEQRVPLDYKDAGVQTTIPMENKSVATSPCPRSSAQSHLSPEVDQTLDVQSSESPVREIRWDDEGMTWEVYGASVDPEVLGLAIQKHLEVQIEQHLQPSELSEENTAEQFTKEKRRSIRTVMHSLRQSNCCVRTSSTTE